MSITMEQKVCLKFCVSNKISCVDALKMIEKAYGDNSISKTQVCEWYKLFKEGRTAIEDFPRSGYLGHPSTSNIDENVTKVKKLVLENPCVSVREIVAELEISDDSVYTILNEVLGMKHVATRLVPKQLNCFQKEYRKNVAEEMIFQASIDKTFMQRIITGDETWIYKYDNETDFENETKPKKLCSKIKTMLIVFFDCRGVVHSEFLPQDKTVNKHYYLGVIKRLREQIRMKRPDLWKDNLWILHHDDLPSLTSFLVRDYLTKYSTNIIPQAPYSPDMAPCDFFLFPKLKLSLCSKRFQTTKAIKENLLKDLKAIPKSAYEKCFQDWIRRWHMCVAQNGDYFEDKINLSE